MGSEGRTTEAPARLLALAFPLATGVGRGLLCPSFHLCVRLQKSPRVYAPVTFEQDVSPQAPVVDTPSPADGAVLAGCGWKLSEVRTGWLEVGPRDRFPVLSLLICLEN